MLLTEDSPMAGANDYHPVIGLPVAVPALWLAVLRNQIEIVGLLVVRGARVHAPATSDPAAVLRHFNIEPMAIPAFQAFVPNDIVKIVRAIVEARLGALRSDILGILESVHD